MQCWPLVSSLCVEGLGPKEIHLNLNLSRDGVSVVEPGVIGVGQIRLVATGNVVTDTWGREPQDLSRETDEESAPYVPSGAAKFLGESTRVKVNSKLRMS